MKTIGEYPDILFRAFDCFEYAQQFLNGFVRFGAVLGYVNIEDEGRMDPTEGTGHYTASGTTTKIQFCSNVFYALCFHRDLKSALETRHGKYVVEISNPLYLAEEITRSLRTLASKHFGGVEGVIVEYDKGQERERLSSIHIKKASSLTPKNLKSTLMKMSLGSYFVAKNLLVIICL
jgi:hypothetical protein